MNTLTATAPNQITFLDDTVTHKNRFDIPSTDGSKTYRVAQAQKTDQWQCSCPSWIYQKGITVIERRPCKHLRAMGDLLLQIEGKAPAAAQVKAAPAALPAGKDAAAAAIAALVSQAEREATEAHAKWITAQAKLDALRLALKAAA